MNAFLLTPQHKKALQDIGVIMLLFYFVFFAGGANSIGSLHAYLFHHILTLVLCVCWIVRIVKYSAPARGTFMDILFLLLICSASISLVFSKSKRFSVEEFTNLLIFIFFFSFIFNHVTTKEQVMKLPVFLFIPAFLSAIIGIVQYAFVYHYTHSWIYSLSVVHSTFGNPNILSGFLVMLIPLCFSFLLTSKRHFKMIYLVMFTVFLLCLFFAFSRAGLVTVVLSFVVMLYLSSPAKVRHCLMLLLPVLLVLMSMFVFLKRYSGGNRERMLMYKSTLKMIRDYPFTGTGPGTFPVVYPEYLIDENLPHSYDDMPSSGSKLPVPISKNPWNTLHAHPHNLFLRILSEFGLVYFFVFIFMIFFVFLTLLRNLKDDLLNIGFVSAIAAFLIFNLFDDMFLIFFISVVFTSFIALALANIHIKQNLHRPGKLSYIQPFVLLPFLLILIKYDVALYYFDKGKTSLIQDKLLEAEANFKTALHFDSKNSVYHSHLAYTYFKDGRLNKAIEQYRQASYLAPSYAFYHRNLAFLYQRTHKKQKERQHKRIARRLDPHRLTERHHKNLSSIIFRRHVADKPLR